MKSDRSTRWFIRVTAPWEHLKLKYKELCGWIDYDSSGVGYHIGSKTSKQHAHIILVLKSELQKQSVDTRCKKLFGVKGSDYSSKIWDGNHKAISYLYHDKSGEVDITPLKLSDAQIKEVNDLVHVYGEIVTTAKQKASYKCVDVVLEAIKESGRTWDAREIAIYIYRGVTECRWHPPGAMMERYVDEIRLKQGTKEDQYAVADAMASAFMLRYYR